MLTQEEAAARLQYAAGLLLRSHPGLPDTPRLQRMTVTAPFQWSPQMIDAAAAIISGYYPQVLSAGLDPAQLPRPRAAAVPPAPDGQPEAPSPAPETGETGAGEPSPPPSTPPAADLDYDGTLDGLRGLALTELHSAPSRIDPFLNVGISSVYDLLARIPLRYIDRSTTTPIGGLVIGETGTTIARVTRSETTTVGPRRLNIARITVADDTGLIVCTFFAGSRHIATWHTTRLPVGAEVTVQGLLDSWTNQATGSVTLQMNAPLIDVIGDDTAPILPIYPQSEKEGLTTWAVHRCAREAVQRLGDLADPLPEPYRAARGLLTRREAFQHVHLPRRPGDEQAGRDRLAYDELLRMQLALGMRRHSTATAPGVAHTPTGHLTGALLESLPYELTDAQRRAVAAIHDDMTRPHPMNRLLQGEVGSGKTLVAVLALLSAVESGKQAALMAPTQVLAEQLLRNVEKFVAGLTRPDGTPVTVAPLVGATKVRARRATLAGLADGSIDIAVGTHALLSDDVAFADLGLVVVDEQHRFGVEQRAALREKSSDGPAPDTLVMTATPIPRTAAMTVFGDLDVTVINELPPGRSPVATHWLDRDPDRTDRDDPLWSGIRAEIAAGRQAYVVCPLIEDSETKMAASAESVAHDLTHGALAGMAIGLVHGKQKLADREEVMARFAAGDVQVLVATTVIEVGVDVPNATVIAILKPDSFGLSQLHQLRGRVGRGAHASTCILVGGTNSPDAQRRVEAMCGTTDGFVLSEIDLELRGAGSILGSRQSGLSDLRVASILGDRDILNAARADARSLLADDPQLSRHPMLRGEVHAALGPDAQAWLERS